MWWFGPFALLSAGAFVWWIVLHRRERSAAAPTPAATKAEIDAEKRARRLLDGEDDLLA
jgi:cytochrome c-type biogenesis protein CcmH/NrfF